MLKIGSHIALILMLLIGLNASGQRKSKKLSYNDQRKFERLFIDASKAKILADYEQAIQLYEACKKVDPSEPAPYYELGNLYVNASLFDEAIENAEKAAELDPENVYYRIMFAEVLKGARYYARAIKEYQSIVEDFPERFEVYAQWALLETIQKEYKTAIDVYNLLEEKIGPTEDLKLKKQYLYIELGDVDKAAGELEDLIELQPDIVLNYLRLAELYYANEKEDKALKAYRKAEEHFPMDPEIQISIASFYMHKRQYKKMFEHLNSAFKSNELDIDSKVKGILELFDLVNQEPQLRDELEALGLTLLEVYPEDPRVLTINGDLAMNMGKPEDARQYFLRAVEKDKSRFPIWNQLMILDAELEAHEDLQKHALEATELFPNQPLCFYFLGYAHSRMEEHQEAAEAYERGLSVTLENGPLLLQFYLGLGDAYNSLKSYESSDEAFEKVLEIDSNNTIALNNYAYYLSIREEKLERALYLSDRANKLEPNSATYLDTKAWILYKLKRYEEAKKSMQIALNYGGENSTEILEHYGDICYQLGQSDEALKFWKKAKEVGEGSEFLDKKISEGKLYE